MDHDERRSYGMSPLRRVGLSLMLLPGCSNKATSAVVPATQRPDLPSMRCSSCRFGYGFPYPVSNCVVVSRSARQTLCSGRSTPSKCRAECQHEIQSYRLRGSLGSQLCLSCLFFVIREVSEPSERVCPLSLSLCSLPSAVLHILL